ncbi:TIGR02594 family protein [Hyphomicrobium sp. LHD-15]|uniref:TIGR02594 family protein n=1 Tax=Hyphomicrobium sp. LHD-15 TaxID=3072142 RepID=UPI0028103E69|nr:TIGR02594 family protein [Hyphomicrobium sp. LHD-15]MDQ8697259.1 TIGR02594 family protein [Hyphomicrobium sp. LHD-15]
MRSACAARLRNALNASAAAGRLSEALASLDDETLRFVLSDWQLWARDDQLPPQTTANGDAWRVWLILGGRGAGKTRSGAEWIRAKALGIAPLGDVPARRIALVGETLADVRRVMIDGVSGLLAIHDEGERPVLEVSKQQLVWPNGAIAQMFSAEDPDSLRGPQFDCAWCDAFCGACLERAGLRATRSLMARSYLKWGEAIAEPRIGAIAVFSRGTNPAEGHVGFWLGETEDSIVLLGGNQGNAVSVARYAKARLLGLRWPSSNTQPASPSPTAIFDRALEHVLEMEGGFSNDALDPGGPTNQGITLGVFAAWRKVTLTAANRQSLIRDLKAIDPVTVREIYRRRYWDTAHCAELPPALAVMHFDAAVNHGVGTAIRFLQETVGAAIDGEIGPETRAAVAAASRLNALATYAALRERRYRALPHFWRFGRGWLRRVDATLTLARTLETETKQSSSPTEGETDMTSTTTATTGKWWGHSITIWGTLVTILSTVVPALAPVTGVEVSGELVQDAGNQVVDTIQTVGTLIGTLMTIFGRMRATTPIKLTLLKAKG